ncbi:MAG TPA: type II toxin-antitoxin system HicB family antitoxin [bacterium]|nr:type II toxin-antitoxin system HicB family antitoxin [bacterium]
MDKSFFIFSGYLIREENGYTAFCPDVDIASEGLTESEAKKNLMEAVSLYVESAIESNLPVVRPVPNEENPVNLEPDKIQERFTIKVNMDISVYA